MPGSDIECYRGDRFARQRALGRTDLVSGDSKCLDGEMFREVVLRSKGPRLSLLLCAALSSCHSKETRNSGAQLSTTLSPFNRLLGSRWYMSHLISSFPIPNVACGIYSSSLLSAVYTHLSQESRTRGARLTLVALQNRVQTRAWVSISSPRSHPLAFYYNNSAILPSVIPRQGNEYDVSLAFLFSFLQASNLELLRPS